jgi:hypothetical protein
VELVLILRWFPGRPGEPLVVPASVEVQAVVENCSRFDEDDFFIFLFVIQVVYNRHQSGRHLQDSIAGDPIRSLCMAGCAARMNPRAVWIAEIIAGL